MLGQALAVDFIILWVCTYITLSGGKIEGKTTRKKGTVKSPDNQDKSEAIINVLWHGQNSESFLLMFITEQYH